MICANPAFEFLLDARACAIARIALNATGFALIGAVVFIAALGCWVTFTTRDSDKRTPLISACISMVAIAGISLVLKVLT